MTAIPTTIRSSMNSFEDFISYVKEAQSNIEIHDFSGKIIARIRCKGNGDQEISNFSGMVLGRYAAKSDTTHDFSGKLLNRGNTLTMLIKDK
jgi:hypothetical protein